MSVRLGKQHGGGRMARHPNHYASQLCELVHSPLMHPPTIGPYQILRELGRGGMGEVFLATDPRLDRQVAIKALPAHLAQDPDRLARFQREAKILASLNHSGIGAIHGLEEVDGLRYLILEYVDGETLADRLANGPIPVSEALSLARQIAEALEVAHEKGVIHRDLKPGNVMVTPDGAVKVLDFGLARTEDGAPSSAAPVGRLDSPTLTSPARLHSPTIPGVIMGTAGYMSPEQARGKPVDKRSDIFSFGCVLYEMLTGSMPFRGENVADAIGATLHKESDLGLLPAQTPRRVRDLLASCLAKDRRNRLHDIGDARLELERAISGPRDLADGVHAWQPWWRSPSVLLSASLFAAAIIIAALSLRASRSAPHVERSVIRANLALPKGMVLPPGDRSVAVSPDGAQVVVALVQKGGTSPQSLYLRDLSRLEFRALPGTEEGNYPFWSPDGTSIAFFAGRELRRIDLADSIVRTICDAPAGRGGTWGTKGTIVFAPGAVGGLSIVSDSGGPASPITEPAAPGESHRVPHMLPDGQRFMYYAMGATPPGVYAFDPGDKQRRLIVASDTEAVFVPPDALVFGRSENLLVQSFDPQRLELIGNPRPIAAAVQWDARRAALNASISPRGTVVYQAVVQPRTATLAWMDRKGERTAISVEPFSLDQDSALAPDARRLAANIAGARGESFLAVLDLERGVRTPLGDPKFKFYYGVLWSPDGQRVLTTDDNGQAQGCVSLPFGGGPPARIFEGEPDFEYGPTSITPDGRTLLLTKIPKRDKIGDIMTLDLAKDQVPKPFMTTPEAEWSPRCSPNGDCVAYLVANEEEPGGVLMVVTYPVPSAPVRVSPARTGRTFGWLSAGELYWVDRSRKVWSAPVSLKEGHLDAGAPKPMFDGRPLDKEIDIVAYDIPRERFLIAIEHEPREDSRLIIVSDWRPESVAAPQARK